MKIQKLDETFITDIGYIPSIKICLYLVQNGWIKRKEVENVSVWTYKKGESVFGIFVPLREDYVDYQNRIIEVLDTLQTVEERSYIKILESLQDVSRLARDSGREILEMRIKYKFEEKFDAAIRKIGSVLKSLQDFFETIGEYKSEKRLSSLNSTELKKHLEVSLVESFQGSFGFRLGFSKVKINQLDMFDQPIAQDVAQEFLDLIKASNSDNPAILENKLSDFRGKSSAKFKSFISNFLTLEANFYLEWGSVNPEKGGAVEISYEKLLQTLELISKRDISNPTIIKFIGRLILAGVDKKNKKNTRFIAISLSNEGEKEYKGSISVNVTSNSKIDLTIGKVFEITLEEISAINTATGDEEITYVLIDLKPI